jgi:hypothetical protein
MMLRGRRADSAAAGAQRPVNLGRLGAIGLGTGAISGFYGIGGGFLVVPGNSRFNSGIFRKHRPGNASESRQNAPADPSASKLSADHTKTHAEQRRSR